MLVVAPGVAIANALSTFAVGLLGAAVLHVRLYRRELTPPEQPSDTGAEAAASVSPGSGDAPLTASRVDAPVALKG
ncbi:MAG: hypothetical protein ACT4OZ_02190 [Gemmatimonadota bacterium]